MVILLVILVNNYIIIQFLIKKIDKKIANFINQYLQKQYYKQQQYNIIIENFLKKKIQKN